MAFDNQGSAAHRERRQNRYAEEAVTDGVYACLDGEWDEMDGDASTISRSWTGFPKRCEGAE